MEEEYGSLGNIRFPDPKFVSMLDSEWNEIKCSCGDKAVGGVFGNEACKVWCTGCDPNKKSYSAQFIYKPPAHCESDEEKLKDKGLVKEILTHVFFGENPKS